MRTDCHIHLDKIGGPHRTPPPSVRDLTDYAEQEAIDLFGGIYERDETLNQFRETGLTIFGFYWERSPQNPNIPQAANGLKLHPYIEQYELSSSVVGPALEVARERNLPVLVHSDDRQPDGSRGRLFAALAVDFPDVPLIIAHAGAYAPPSIDDGLVAQLVNEAIDAACAHSNILLEVCILANPLKARLLAKRAPLDRVLLGSDFPIGRGRCGSVVFQENALRRAGLDWSQIESLHANGRRVLQF